MEPHDDDISYVTKVSGWLVTEMIEGASAMLPKYPLLPGDPITEEDDGTFTKHAPGLGVGGFRLTPEQRATLTRCDDASVAIGGLGI